MEEYKEDNLGVFGCCLVCDECGFCDNPCPTCGCKKCTWYVKYTGWGKCGYLLFKRDKIWFEENTYKRIAGTTKAILIRFSINKNTYDETNKEVWLPKSQIKFSTAKTLFDKELIDEYLDDKPNEEFIGIPRWLIEEKSIKTKWEILDGLSIEEYEKEFLSETYPRGTWDDI